MTTIEQWKRANRPIQHLRKGKRSRRLRRKHTASLYAAIALAGVYVPTANFAFSVSMAFLVWLGYMTLKR